MEHATFRAIVKFAFSFLVTMSSAVIALPVFAVTIDSNQLRIQQACTALTHKDFFKTFSVPASTDLEGCTQASAPALVQYCDDLLVSKAYSLKQVARVLQRTKRSEKLHDATKKVIELHQNRTLQLVNSDHKCITDHHKRLARVVYRELVYVQEAFITGKNESEKRISAASVEGLQEAPELKNKSMSATNAKEAAPKRAVLIPPLPEQKKELLPVKRSNQILKEIHTKDLARKRETKPATAEEAEILAAVDAELRNNPLPTSTDTPSSRPTSAADANRAQEKIIPKEPYQPPALGIQRPTIVSVTFLNDENKKLKSSRFLPFIQQKVGAELDVKILGDDVNTLKKEFPEYASIVPSYANPNKDKDKVELTFEFLRKRIIRSIRIIVPPEIEEPREGLTDRITTKIGTLVRGSNVSADKDILRRLFVNFGFPKVEVPVEVNFLDKKQGTVELIYRIKLNSKQAKLRSVKITGNSSIDDKEVEKVMKTSAAWHAFVSGGSTFNAFQLDTDEKAITELYKQEGFADVSVDSSYSMNKNSEVQAVFKIKEGKRYTIRSVKIVGNQNYSSEELAQIIPFRVGSAYSGKTLRKTLQALRDFYGERGRIFANVKADYDEQKGELLFTINEDGRYYINQINIIGNRKTIDDTIRNYFADMSEGDMVNTEKMNQAINELRSTGYFSEVQVQFDPIAPGRGDIIVILKEAGNQSIDFGFGYGLEGGFNGDASYSYRNAFGRGMDFSVVAMKSEEVSRLKLIFRDRRSFGLDLDTQATGGYERYNYDGFEKDIIGARVVVEKEIIKNLRAGVGTRLEFVGIHEVEAGMPAEVFARKADGRVMLAGLIGTLIYSKEKRNQMGDEVGGYKIRMAMFPSYADGEVFAKVSSTVLGHQTLYTDSDERPHVLTGRVTLGYASENTPFYERFYGGGNGTIRAFKAARLTPEGSKVGGNVLASGGAYYSFPLYEQNFRGVVFAEAASVGNGFSDLGNVRVIGGVGVRANLRDTFLKNRVEAGFLVPAITEPGDELKPFYLMLGTYHPIYDL